MLSELLVLGSVLLSIGSVLVAYKKWSRSRNFSRRLVDELDQRTHPVQKEESGSLGQLSFDSTGGELLETNDVSIDELLSKASSRNEIAELLESLELLFSENHQLAEEGLREVCAQHKMLVSEQRLLMRTLMRVPLLGAVAGSIVVAALSQFGGESLYRAALCLGSALLATLTGQSLLLRARRELRRRQTEIDSLSRAFDLRAGAKAKTQNS